MYLIEYSLIVGITRHYAPSAMAAVKLVRDIRAGGGSVSSITRTRDQVLLTFEQLETFAQEEIGPADQRARGFKEAWRQLLKGGPR